MTDGEIMAAALRLRREGKQTLAGIKAEDRVKIINTVRFHAADVLEYARAQAPVLGRARSRAEYIRAAHTR